MKKAIHSLMEELDAIGLYHQRADACKDPHLKKILLHNADEEKEHAAMLIEWLRQNDKVFSRELKENLFSKDKNIVKPH